MFFTTTGGTSHSNLISGPANGTIYSYYVRRQDTSGNADTTDFLISFSIATASADGGSGTTASSNFATYRTDDNGGLNFWLLTSWSDSVGTAPRDLRLESQGERTRCISMACL